MSFAAGSIFQELERGRRSITVIQREVTDRGKQTLILRQNTAHATALLIREAITIAPHRLVEPSIHFLHLRWREIEIIKVLSWCTGAWMSYSGERRRDSAFPELTS